MSNIQYNVFCSYAKDSLFVLNKRVFIYVFHHFIFFFESNITGICIDISGMSVEVVEFHPVRVNFLSTER